MYIVHIDIIHCYWTVFVSGVTHNLIWLCFLSIPSSLHSNKYRPYFFLYVRYVDSIRSTKRWIVSIQHFWILIYQMLNSSVSTNIFDMNQIETRRKEQREREIAIFLYVGVAVRLRLYYVCVHENDINTERPKTIILMTVIRMNEQQQQR